MKIYAISDLHGRLEGLDPKGVDLVLVAGDFAPMHGWSAVDIDYQVCWINATLREWISSYPIIPGNHDLFAQNSDFLPDVRIPKNAKLLIDQADEVDGLRIYGTPWVPYINGSWAFEEMCPGQLREKFSAIPKDGTEIGLPDMLYDDGAAIVHHQVKSARRARVRDCFPVKGARLDYIYDFGDWREHHIRRMADSNVEEIACVKATGDTEEPLPTVASLTSKLREAVDAA